MSYSTHIQEKSQSHGWFCVNKRNLAQWRYTEYALLLQGNCFFIRFFSEIKKIYSDRKVSLVSTHYFCSTKYCRDPLICERCRFLEDNAVWVNLLIGDNQIKGFLVMITQGCWKMNLSVRKSISCAKIFIFHQRQNESHLLRWLSFWLQLRLYSYPLVIGPQHWDSSYYL